MIIARQQRIRAMIGVGDHHSRRPRERSCDSMTDSSSCALFNPARPLLELLIGSLSIRRSAAATRSRARSKSAMVYCRGSGRMRFFRGRFAALLERMSCLPVVIVPLRSRHLRAAVRATQLVTEGSCYTPHLVQSHQKQICFFAPHPRIGFGLRFCAFPQGCLAAVSE
jgi:hypothetical protein